MFVRFGCVYCIWVFRPCMVKQMLYIGKAPKGKIPHIWHLWNLKIPKPRYVSSLKTIGLLHLIVLGASEKNYLWQCLWIILYFFWQCFFLRSVSACWLAALVPTVPLWWGNPYKRKQILMTNIKILFPFPRVLKIEMKRFDKTIEEDWAFGVDCKCFFPISNVRVTKLWKNQNFCLKHFSSIKVRLG